MVSLTISTRSQGTITLKLPAETIEEIDVAELKTAIHAEIPKLIANRQRITLPVGEGKPLPLTDDNRSLASYGVEDGATLRLKDLGRQIGYRALYLWEYAGPICINPLFLHFSHLLWGPYEHSALQLMIRNYTVLHFAKRFFESAFVHDFSRATVPFSYVLRNCLYYWGMCGLLMGLTLYRPAYSADALKGSILDAQIWRELWSMYILVNEMLNFYTHLHLRSLRVPPGHPRKYPTGLGFDTVVCANYWFETLMLLGLVAVTGGDIGTIAYVCVAVYFMHRWSGQKYRRYQKEFDPKVFPGKRWKMFPPIY